MESSSSSRFRFRDHQEMGDDSNKSDNTPVVSSVSSDGDGESELESMTGKGIKHLCSELLELKKASDEDFHKTIFSNYSAFVRIFEEVEVIKIELMQLKQHVSTQKKLVKDLTDGIYLNVLSKETIELIIEDPICAKSSPLSKLEAHIHDVSETLDTLLSERRLDEALGILEIEAQTFQGIKFEENFPQDVLMWYNSAISERKVMLANQLIMVAENPRVSAPELQKALSGLCRLGDSHLATHLLLKYYHAHMATGIYALQRSKSLLRGVYIRELAKFVFSKISQAARCFSRLYGEASPYASELIHWACEETNVFVTFFSKYVKSISEISGGLSTAVDAVQFAMSFCSLLENQRIVLRPCLIKQIRPCMEEVLQNHIDHFKKVIGIFTTTDAWVLGKYLVSGILSERCSSIIIGKQPEYCLLTNSGRKIVTLLQAITEDISPLVALQMEGSILKGLMDLFAEYISMLERAITCETHIAGKGSSGIKLAESLPQQVSVLANLSTLERFFSSIIGGIFQGMSHFNYELWETHSASYQERELDSCILFIQEASGRLRAYFFQHVIGRLSYPEDGCRLTPEPYIGGQGDSNSFDNVMPSFAFQVLFSELRKLEKLIEENTVEENWLMELLRELMEAIFAWISKNEEIWRMTQEDLYVQPSDNFKQFAVDIQFLVEMARYGGYFSENIMNAALALVSRMELTYISAELDPKRDEFDDAWAINAAIAALHKLQEIENSRSFPNEPLGNLEEQKEHQSQYADDSPQKDDSQISSGHFIESDEDSAAMDLSEFANYTETEIPPGESVDRKEQDGFDDRSTVNSADPSVLGDMEAENAARPAVMESTEVEETELCSILAAVGVSEEACSQSNDSGSHFYKLGDGTQTELHEIEVTSTARTGQGKK